MKLEIINENKLKITFDSSELEENGISVHTFLAGSTIVNKFIFAILEIAEEELDFKYKDCNVNLESFSFNHTHFVIYITKEKLIPSKNMEISSKLNEIVYCFSSQREALDCLKRNHHYLNYFYLYKYNHNYFLIINLENMPLKQIKTGQISFLDENTINFTSNIIISKIKEFGKFILNQNNILKISNKKSG